jgi:hypothetical protein
MAAYTMPLKVLIEQPSQYETGLSMKEKIEKGRQALFDFDYPFFDPDYKKVFETNFIRYFYTREIGFETEGLFKFQLESWLILHMPYFNLLFESETFEFDPLKNTDMDVTHNRKNDTNQSSNATGTSNNTGKSTSNATNESDNFNRQLDSNNPDSRLAITTNDGQGVIEYASSITENNENNKNTSDGTTNVSSDTTDEQNVTNDINSIEDYIEHRSGKTGSQTYSKMLQEYRQSLIRIEKDIFEEMQPLFMGVY